ncbi:MAG: helix-turn-helix domain-containing protein [Myxococcota bacterium]|nr:helix-turn-helix domain-containing protein [Myxococcota bacterium]
MAKRKRGRPKVELAITDVERVELQRLTKRAHVNRSIAFRARIVLGCADDSSNIAVAERLRTTDQTVGKWRNRFIASRLDGLYDEPRVGGPEPVNEFETPESTSLVNRLWAEHRLLSWAC